jgi:hypothetical protein
VPPQELRHVVQSKIRVKVPAVSVSEVDFFLRKNPLESSASGDSNSGFAPEV